jgi:hypothetical protein
MAGRSFRDWRLGVCWSWGTAWGWPAFARALGLERGRAVSAWLAWLLGGTPRNVCGWVRRRAAAVPGEAG